MIIDKTCREFVEETASGAPVPGGGSVAALVGAMGAALGSMVGALTMGRKKYAGVQDEMKRCRDELESLRKDLLDLIQEDIEGFRPLSRLYGRKPGSDEEKEACRVEMEKALTEACRAPLMMMEKCGRAIELSRICAFRGNRTAVSDAGACAVLCRAAMQTASMSVYINTGMMKDREAAGRINGRCASCLVHYSAAADEVSGYVAGRLTAEE